MIKGVAYREPDPDLEPSDDFDWLENAVRGVRQALRDALSGKAGEDARRDTLEKLDGDESEEAQIAWATTFVQSREAVYREFHERIQRGEDIHVTEVEESIERHCRN